MNSELRFYVSILLRRLPLIVVITGILTGVSVYIALTLPTTYRAEALLLIESPQIPGELASSTVSDNVEEQLEIIEQRLLTRANLLEIADKFAVFPNRSEMVPDEIVDRMRAQTGFRRSGGGRGGAARTLTVSFSAQRPGVTAEVVNEYVTRVLQENVQMRTGIAEETLSFFEQEADRLGQDLDLQSQRILEFKNANIDALPEGMDYRMNRQSLLTERLAQLQRDRESLLDQRRRIIEIFEATGRVAGAPQASLSPDQRQLQQLQDELQSARALYSEQNPRIRVLVTRIEQLESRVAETSGATDTSVDPNQALLNLQLGEIDSRVEYIDEQTGIINAELNELENAIAKTPSNSITLQALERDYANIQSRYDAANARLAAAAVGERIELTSKGQRISVLRQAIVPRQPDSPNRPLIAAGGFAASLGIATAIVVLLELLNRTVRRPADLARALQITPLGTVPYIATRNESYRKRGGLMAVIAIIAIGIPAGLYLLHVQYMPLDLLADRAMSRFGL